MLSGRNAADATRMKVVKDTICMFESVNFRLFCVALLRVFLVRRVFFAKILPPEVPVVLRLSSRKFSNYPGLRCFSGQISGFYLSSPYIGSFSQTAARFCLSSVLFERTFPEGCN